ncbi:hypothetical protein [Brachyspira hyodysenteriae]|uniref:hypothetical protein n=1 Tax=Brachyspira hyodysenteriae TaxID=159 RepID=UPI0022CD6273|nr:hypothetical protein [Brachyspira hyodysenteriae]MCZ9991897.1 hypothetical protein [Brachyspira hyodysenteriae]
MEEVKEEIKNPRNDIKSYERYLDDISEDFIKIDLRREKVRKLRYRIFYRKRKKIKIKKKMN